MQLFVTSHPALNERDQVREIHKCLRGFVFLGTDHYNWPSTSGLLERMAIANKMIWTPTDAKAGLDDLAEFQDQAPRINHDFAFRGGENFPMACFYETGSSKGATFQMKKVSSSSYPMQQVPSTMKQASVGSRRINILLPVPYSVCRANPIYDLAVTTGLGSPGKCHTSVFMGRE